MMKSWSKSFSLVRYLVFSALLLQVASMLAACNSGSPSKKFPMSGTVPQPCACKVNDTRMLLLMRLHLGACLWKERPS